MKRIISDKLVAHIVFGMLSLVVIFHLLVLAGVVPFNIIWGGRLMDYTQMLRFETVSIIVNLLMLCVIGIKAGFVKVRASKSLVKIALWLMSILFLLNTLGNLYSNNGLERLVFTPQTAILALFCFQLAISKEDQT